MGDTANLTEADLAELEAYWATKEPYWAKLAVQRLAAAWRREHSRRTAAEAEVERLRARVAAGPQATPRVLWEGETWGLKSDPRSILPHGTSFSVPRGTHVRVVAAPAGQEDDR